MFLIRKSDHRNHMASRAVQHFIEILKDAKEILFVIPTSGLQGCQNAKNLKK